MKGLCVSFLSLLCGVFCGIKTGCNKSGQFLLAFTGFISDTSTGHLLDILKKESVKGVFYVDLQSVKTAKDKMLLSQMASEGHDVGLEIVAECKETKMADVKKKIAQSVSDLEKITGVGVKYATIAFGKTDGIMAAEALGLYVHRGTVDISLGTAKKEASFFGTLKKEIEGKQREKSFIATGIICDKADPVFWSKLFDIVRAEKYSVCSMAECVDREGMKVKYKKGLDNAEGSSGTRRRLFVASCSVLFLLMVVSL
ncbi:MAG: uncharacterized protein A8A55_0632 [Amphiamblys sp. WSBS2006]|nr:MAG: uncharacterized protein A8A55_0632 [Amphiamblys sp. WSBS2006]